MKKLRGSSAARWISILLLAVSMFGFVFCGMSAYEILAADGYGILDASAWKPEEYLQSRHYTDLLEEYKAGVVQLYEIHQGYWKTDLPVWDQQKMIERLEAFQDPESTNFRYRVLYEDGRLRDRGNCKMSENFEQDVSESVYTTLYLHERDGEFYFSDVIDDGESTVLDTVVFNYGILTDLPIHDDFWQANQTYIKEINALRPLLVATAALAVVMVLLLSFLLWCAGHRGDEIYLTKLDGVWLELLLTITFFVEYILLSIFVEHTVYWWQNKLLGLVLISSTSAVMLLLGLPLLVTTVVRLKTHTFWRTTLLYQLAALCAKGARSGMAFCREHLALVVRVALLWFGYDILVCMIVTGLWSGDSCMVLTLLNLLLCGACCYWAACFARVRAGAEKIASGSTEYQIDLAVLPPDLKKHADQLNHISNGINAAVEARMRSERFRSELITNVSHDLKTPLTSIINYVDLLKKEQLDNERAAEYVAVLDEKSLRLKKLTEDLIEASKASTGALPVNLERLGMVQLVKQAVGEYEDRLTAANLTPVLRVPEQECYLCADGHHMWRILDNVLSNCLKYAMPQTRIYLEVRAVAGQVLLSVKNISKEPITVSAEELIERFVQGDSSRTAEGSGLGLSIARSLAELQGGSFDIAVDGDLFKVVLLLPQA